MVDPRVSLLIVALLLAVLQVAVYVHVRNVVTASAQEGARFAANADVDSGSGAARTVEVVARATSTQTAGGLSCASAEEVEGSGLTLVVVRCGSASSRPRSPPASTCWSPAARGPAGRRSRSS